MNIKRLTLLGVTLFALLLGACGSKDEVKQKKLPAAVEERQNKTETVEAVTEQKDEGEAMDTEQNDKGDGTILNPYIAEHLNADVEVIYTNKDPGLKHAYSDDVSIQIDKYQIVHVSNMNESSKT